MPRLSHRKKARLALLPLGLGLLALGWAGWRVVRRERLAQPLLTAIKAGDTAQVRVCLAAGVSPDTRDHPDYTPPTLSEIVRRIVHPTSPPKDTAPTALLAALHNGKPETVNLLLQAGASVETKGDYDFNDPSGAAWFFNVTPLEATIFTNRTDCAHRLLEAGANVKRTGTDGMTPLMLAAQYNRVTILADLLKFGANPNHANAYGRTALRYAADNSLPPANHETFRLLAENGANVNAIDGDGTLPLVWLAHDAGMVAYLLAKGAKLEAREGKDWTPLIELAQRRDGAGVRNLLARGANPNAHSKTGQTALMFACIKGQTETVRDLLAHGATVNIKDIYGNTALDDACHWSERFGLETLPPNARNPQLSQVLDNHIAIVRMLLARHAKFNAATNGGETPLMIAAYDSHPEIVRLLLTAGANPRLKDRHGKTALQQASSVNFDIELLVTPRRIQQTIALLRSAQ